MAYGILVIKYLTNTIIVLEKVLSLKQTFWYGYIKTFTLHRTLDLHYSALHVSVTRLRFLADVATFTFVVGIASVSAATSVDFAASFFFRPPRCCELMSRSVVVGVGVKTAESSPNISSPC